MMVIKNNFLMYLYLFREENNVYKVERIILCKNY